MPKRAASILALLLPLAAVGCAGRARMEFSPLHFKSIDPPAPQSSRVNFDRCYWWTDEGGRLWVAMERTFAPWFNPKLRVEVQISLQLEKLPAGAARNYPIGRRELRARIKFGVWESRFSSVAGIAAVYRESGDRLRGSLRMQTSRVSSELIGGWGEPSIYLMQGAFNAVHDEQRGREIATLTESQGWERPPIAPTSSPSPLSDSPAPTSAPTDAPHTEP